jgi:stage III sporulation protein AB
VKKLTYKKHEEWMVKMLKLIGSLILVMGSCALGFIYSNRLILRKRFLEQYLQFLNFLETQIIYSMDTPARILNKYKGSKEFEMFSSHCKKNLLKHELFSESWKKGLEQIKKEFGLTSADFDLINDFGQKLGTSDIEGQISHCELHKKLITNNFEEAAQEKKQKERLYITLGLAFGASLALVFL